MRVSFPSQEVSLLLPARLASTGATEKSFTSESWSRSQPASLNDNTLRSATTCDGTDSLFVAITGLWLAINGRTPAFTPGKLESTRSSRCPSAGGLTDHLCQAELLADGAQLLAFEAVSVAVLQPLPMVDIEVAQNDTTHGIRSMQQSLFLEAVDDVDFSWSRRALPASNHARLPLSAFQTSCPWPLPPAPG